MKDCPFSNKSEYRDFNPNASLNGVQLDQRLLDPKVFDDIFKKLEKKLHTLSERLSEDPEYLSLRWVLEHENEVRRLIKKVLKNGAELGTGKLISIQMSEKVREIVTYPWPERILLMALAKVLQEAFTPLYSSNLYSFQKGKGTIHAHLALKNFLDNNTHKKLYLLKRDVSKYGDSIPQDVLMKRAGSTLKLEHAPIVRELLRSAIRCELKDVKTGASFTAIHGIPSGSPIVPPLENFYLLSLDHAMSSLPNVFYARYGDDFVVITDSPTLAWKADRMIEDCMHQLGLHIKPEKKINAVVYPGFRFEWLGRSITFNPVRLGPKQKHTRDSLTYLKKSVRTVFERSLIIEKVEAREKYLNSALQKIMSLERAEWIRLTTSPIHQETLALIQNEFIHVLLKTAQHVYGISKSKSWKLYRRVKPHTLNHQINLRFRKKKAHATLKKAA